MMMIMVATGMGQLTVVGSEWMVFHKTGTELGWVCTAGGWYGREGTKVLGTGWDGVGAGGDGDGFSIDCNLVVRQRATSWSSERIVLYCWAYIGLFLYGLLLSCLVTRQAYTV